MSAEPLSATAPIEHKLPEGWREVPLASVAEVRFSGVNKLSLPSERPVRLCNYTDVYNNDYITGDLEFMRATATQPEINRFGLRLGDVIITKDSETPDDIGIAAAVDYTAPDLLCGYHLALIRPRTEEVDPTFLAKQLRHHRLARYFGQRANGLTRYGLPTAVVASAPLWLPEPAKQMAIGAILRLVDEAIAKAEAVIAKLKQVRAGLLHDLLTRGLDEHGQLRDPIAHPEQFQDSSLGRIPREWGMRSLRQLTDYISYGFTNPMPTTTDGPWMLTAFDVGDGEIKYEQARHTSQDAFDSLLTAKSKPRVGDVLVTKDGSLGRVAAVDREGVCINQSVAVLRSLPSTDTEYMVLFLRSPAGQSAMLAEAGGSTIKHIYITKLAEVLLPYPPTAERARIVEALARSEAELSIESSEVAKLRLLKSGLMTDLLTGRVRVPVSLQDVDGLVGTMATGRNR